MVNFEKALWLLYVATPSRSSNDLRYIVTMLISLYPTLNPTKIITEMTLQNTQKSVK